MNEVADFLRDLKGSTALVPHGDADGCASAAIISLLLKRLGKPAPDLLFPEHGWSRLDPALLEKLKGFKNVIVLDIGEKSGALLAQLAEHSSLCWIDHHKDPEEIKGNFVYFNPHEEGLGEYSAPPASYITYNLASRLTDMDKLCWISAVGSVGDKSEKRCRDVIDKTFRLFPHLKGSPEFSELSILRKFVTLVSSGRTTAGADGAKLSTENFIDAGESPILFLSSEKGRFLRKQMDATKRMTDEILRRRAYEVHPNLVLCEVNSQYTIQNYVASRLREFFPDKAIAVTNISLKEGARAELRRGPKSSVDLRTAAQSIASLFPNSSGGGHRAAAGIRTSATWPELKKAILSYFSKQASCQS